MDYKKVYSLIIEKAKNRKLEDEDYFESHHIIPKCLGGSNEKENLVKLLFREHYLCHWLLHRIYPNSKGLSYAFWIMSNRNKGLIRVSSRAYEESRESYIKNFSQFQKERYQKMTKKEREELSNKISQTRLNWSEEEKKKNREQASKTLKGKTISEEQKDKWRETYFNKTEEEILERNKKNSLGQTGKVLSEETKRKIAETSKGKPKVYVSKEVKSEATKRGHETRRQNKLKRLELLDNNVR